MNGKDRCMGIWFGMTWLMTELLKLFLHNNRDKMDWNGFFPDVIWLGVSNDTRINQGFRQRWRQCYNDEHDDDVGNDACDMNINIG